MVHANNGLDWIQDVQKSEPRTASQQVMLICVLITFFITFECDTHSAMLGYSNFSGFVEMRGEHLLLVAHNYHLCYSVFVFSFSLIFCFCAMH